MRPTKRTVRSRPVVRTILVCAMALAITIIPMATGAAHAATAGYPRMGIWSPDTVAQPLANIARYD